MISPSLRLLAGVCLCAAFLSAASPGIAQSRPPVPTAPVAIENTNAVFTPTADTVPEADPARPTVTLPARIPPTGYVQFEQGFNEANTSPAGTVRQAALNQTTKIALTTRLMTQLISQPYTYNVTAANAGGLSTDNAPGDLIVAVQGIVHKSAGPVPTAALQYFRRVRAGTSDNLDVADYSQGAMLLLSGDLSGNIHYDSNFAVYEQNNAAVRRPQVQESVELSHPLFAGATHGHLAGALDLSSFSQPFVQSDVSGHPVTGAHTFGMLFAVSYTLRSNLVFDMSLDHGLTSTSTQWQGGFGFTYLLPHRLWRDRRPEPIAVGPYTYGHASR